ncbi:hypothetical protein [Caulobacter sp. Root1472]|uniref:hypothetical protein n=1 Tax=Caulobacter sp. Root1472 TaxID=1736470 RepID=UPI000AE6D84D|nr:hypothetical protein [Caulobacter sp. Root1472]
MADAAQVDDNDFTPTYSGLKKAALVTAALLLIFSLPAVSIKSEFSLLGIPVNGFNGNFLRFGLFVTSVLYTSHFTLVWFMDGWAYARRTKANAGTLAARISQQLDEISDLETLATEQVALLGKAVEGAGSSPTYEWKLVQNAFGESVIADAERLAEGAFSLDMLFNHETDDLIRRLNVERLPNIEEVGRYGPLIVDVARDLVRRAQYQATVRGDTEPLFLNRPLVDKLTESSAQLDGLTSRLRHLAEQMKQVKLELFFVDAMPRIRVLLDFCPVALLSAVAWLHFVGDTWFSLWPDAASVLTGLHVIGS